MKDGSGNLDFGSDDDQEDGDSAEPDDVDRPGETTERESTTQSEGPLDGGNATGQRRSKQNAGQGATPQRVGQKAEYPYFVRRNNVTDERNHRLECHVRPEVAQQESDFRTQVAAALGTDSISKTDAREFALKFAFENPEAVADLMREEGFDVVR